MKSTCWDTRATESIIKSGQKDTEASILHRRLQTAEYTLYNARCTLHAAHCTLQGTRTSLLSVLGFDHGKNAVKLQNKALPKLCFPDNRPHQWWTLNYLRHPPNKANRLILGTWIFIYNMLIVLKVALLHVRWHLVCPTFEFLDVKFSLPIGFSIK